MRYFFSILLIGKPAAVSLLISEARDNDFHQFLIID